MINNQKMSYNRTQNNNDIKKVYPQTKIILPPHLREEPKKRKIISISNNKKNINNEIEKNRINDFLELYNIQDK